MKQVTQGEEYTVMNCPRSWRSIDSANMFILPNLVSRIVFDIETLTGTINPTTLDAILVSDNYPWQADTSKSFPNMVKEYKELLSSAAFSDANIKRMYEAAVRMFKDSASRIDELKLVVSPENAEHFNLPENFNAAHDARAGWGACASVIEHVYDQAGCGNCFIVATVAALSDRNCIASLRYANEPVLKLLSSADAMQCCGDDCRSCGGGYGYVALDYWLTEGLVTGSDFGDNTSCMPYLLKPCGSPCTYNTYRENMDNLDRNCSASCVDGSPKLKYKGKQAYTVTIGGNQAYQSFFDVMSDYPGGPTAEDIEKLNNTVNDITLDEFEKMMKFEIMTRGPVTSCAIDVMIDFNFYKTGIYLEYGGGRVGSHCMKIIGWGVTNNIKYWRVVNSYGKDWGENGAGKLMINGRKGGKPFFNDFHAGVADHTPV